MNTTNGAQRPGQPTRPTHNLSSSPPAQLSTLSTSRHQQKQHPQRHAHTKEYTDEKLDPAFAPPQPHRCNAALHINAVTVAQGRSTLLYPHALSQSSVPSCSQQCSTPSRCSMSHFPSTSSPFSISSRTASTPTYIRPRGLRIANLLKPWIPIILYAITSLGFLAAVSLWKAEVFQGLDQLSHWLQSDEYIGYAVIFLLIFLTTFPPLPLYSTLIILSGYTFGPWTGVIISYCASLIGALAVFIISRTFFRESISHWLNCTITIKRVVRAIEKRPKLLFLIRLAPYPFNVMNCLLAASSTLTLRTYTICTALSLFKLIIHTSIGNSIHSFAEYHVTKPGQATSTKDGSMLGHYSTIVGTALCVAILLYLSYVARKAVDDELEDDAISSEETMAFLSNQDNEGQDDGEMVESPFRSQPRASFSSLVHGDRFELAGREEASIGLGH